MAQQTDMSSNSAGINTTPSVITHSVPPVTTPPPSAAIEMLPSTTFSEQHTNLQNLTHNINQLANPSHPQGMPGKTKQTKEEKRKQEAADKVAADKLAQQQLDDPGQQKTDPGLPNADPAKPEVAKPSDGAITAPVTLTSEPTQKKPIRY